MAQGYGRTAPAGGVGAFAGTFTDTLPMIEIIDNAPLASMIAFSHGAKSSKFGIVQAAVRMLRARCP